MSPGVRGRVALIVAACLLGCGEGPSAGEGGVEPAPPAVPDARTEGPPAPGRAGAVSDARLRAAEAEPGAWLAHGRTWSEQRYSPLAQVHAGNVAELGPAWVVPLGTTRGVEATPLVVDGVLYTTLPWSVVLALEAATGRELWRFDPEVPKALGRRACCDVVNRGVAVYRGRVYVGTLDGRLVALDAATGEPAWSVRTTDPREPYTITGAPRVAKGLVFLGNGGAEFGVRGYLSAYDAETGALRWRFYTVPGPPGTPPEHPEVARAAETWPEDALYEGGLGGTVWDSMAYDPELDLLYAGVGNASVYDRARRSPGGGDNLFLASILALRPDTGRLVWHYQTVPGENWDYTATQHMILADLEIGGRTRQVLMQAPKNGFFYVLDRATGELLSAEKYVTANWASHVDLETGRPVETGRAEWKDGRAMVIPGPAGGHNWHPMAFHPGTGLVYVPSQEMPYPFHADEDFALVPETFNTGEDFAGLARELEGYERTLRFCDPTHLTAWDPVGQRAVWRVDHDSEIQGGALATAGNLVFKSTGDGELLALRATDGERLWKEEIGIAVMAPPVTYAVDGVQYLAVMVGAGGSAGLNFTSLDYENAGYAIAWRLGGGAALPEVQPREAAPPAAEPPFDPEPEAVERGHALYHRHCFRCHGIGTKSGGLLPDLRRSPPEVHARWEAIVLSGTRADRGMASFADVLSREEARDIHAYVVAQALREPGLLPQVAAWLVAQGACVPGAWIAD